MNVDSLIKKAGGAAEIAQLTGVSTEAVRKWRQAGMIPTKHWPALLHVPGITLADLNETSEETSAMTHPTDDMPPRGATAVLVLADGSHFWGRGFGAFNDGAAGELCFSTGMTGYQETLTDPSFAGQIITFTFPHIGNVGTNGDDDEAPTMAALGLVVKEDVTAPASWRSIQPLQDWLKAHGRAGISGVDTRGITRLLRDKGPQNALLFYPKDGRFDLAALRQKAAEWPGLEGMDLVKEVAQPARSWTKTTWHNTRPERAVKRRVVALDYGAKDNILRSLVAAGCEVHVLPGTATGEEILALKPEGVFLSNGPADPAATAVYAVPAIQAVMEADIPVFGICLGHQLLARALGGTTYKLDRGHRGANQPVKDLTTGRVEITSQNHGFAVDEKSLPDTVRVTHVSLFDGSNEGLASTVKEAFSVQYHPEASPGPTDSFYLFERFVAVMDRRAAARTTSKAGA
ncbi:MULTISPECIES: glutamine-hydrolyzing carbamoyl-phosphate synthase small subunit [Acetobacteraceae]|uniref:Carbamoyl phosphate synthase small chain n=1 Tax=Parasaccharibacter apium TaxID=1510841 RepID=A0A7U7G4B6_9PROT|nr:MULTISPECIES: glutamine-hydrolyzing carbamoyl-phosphate synthase small subunit [Acetobacteraceae]MCL1562525.1 carbamoyl-phosphate synthase small subunit [Parasaccharibacter sp. TMW 2.1886]MUG79779.1 glutamine-hydrolyzing carbamoyl-phosphate synthase small subunit [Bombella sp. ESL0380]MUH03070.1 glutamine-hydrolyzing carbamoyl-phosphate synthase small subunit [Bombella sp. ESL0387]MCL1513937.1 carbamoyl-phosphate synthase small subunit [Parasaccharibacter sp. TMW 2.1891]MCL1515338.1 carbamo